MVEVEEDDLLLTGVSLTIWILEVAARLMALLGMGLAFVTAVSRE
jgi:hypothetical protein